MRMPKEIPLGLGYIASFLKQAGYGVEVLDIDGNGYSKEQVEKIISTAKCDCFGIGGLSSTYKYIKWLSSIIKFYHPYKKIFAGNMVAIANPEALLKNSMVDVAVIGEGEIVCKELMEVQEGKRSLESVKGICYKENGKVIFTGHRERIKELDNLPLPAWELFPVEVYIRNPIYRENGLRSLNISTMRGCPFDCTFCSRAFGKLVTKRSAQSIVSEIKELVKRFNVQYVAIIDDLFISDKKHVYEFCDRMIQDKVNVKWGAAGRVNLITEELLKKMKSAGCDLLSFGFESGSQKMLDAMKKNVKVEQAVQAIDLTRKAGIRVIGSFMIGIPGETKETIEETVDFIKRTNLPNYKFFLATPYPDTELYKTGRAVGRIKENEDEFLDRLGEMADTLSVNLTDFSDKDLIDIKRYSEERLKKEARLKVKLERGLDVWQSRLGKIKMGLRYDGLITTFGYLFQKIARIEK